MPISSLELVLAASVLAICIVIVHFGTLHRTRHTDLPPGPPGTSYILGNASDIPSRPDEWKKYHQMSKRYGPVMHLRALNRHIIVLDTIKAAVELLEKRGAIYSDRPRLPLVGELMGYEWNVFLMRYGDVWRQHRRVLHQHMSESAVAQLHQKQERVNSLFLRALLEAPGDWWTLTHWLAGTNNMSAVYGLDDTKFRNDPWIQLGEDTVQIANEVFNSGLQAVDIFPFLKYIPSWFPGAGFKRRAKDAYELQIRAREHPFAWVKERLTEGTAVPCITTAMLEADVDGMPIPEEIVKNCAGVAYIAGAETTLSILKSFFLAMVRNPDVQRKAQEEIDRVALPERLPSLADRDASRYPYLEAVLRETYRKYPPVPLGLPHTVIQADEYQGMRIPLGSIMITNIWSMTHDEQTYPEPHRFRPERFLRDGRIYHHEDARDPRDVVFGFGRRICPGRHFADAEIWLMMATMLYCFDVLPMLDERGEEIVPTEEIAQGTIIAPVEFPCLIVPRSHEKRSLILHACEQLA